MAQVTTLDLNGVMGPIRSFSAKTEFVSGTSYVRLSHSPADNVALTHTLAGQDTVRLSHALADNATLTLE